MPIHLSLKDHQINDLAVLRDLKNTQLEEIITKIDSLFPPPLKIKEIKRVFSEVIGDDKATDAIMRQVTSATSLLSQRKVKVEELLEGLDFAINSSTEVRWNKDELIRWQIKRKLLCKLFSQKKICTVVKALEISYEYPNLLQTSKIITDIRPIFNDDGSLIKGAIVSHSLLLYYDSTSGNNSISISIDRDDIKQLRDSCDRALRKANTGKELMVNKAGIPSYISGQDEIDE